jgi:hypothetical protein
MRSGYIKHRHDIYDEAPLFVPKEAHEEDEENGGPSKLLNPIVARKADQDERTSGNEKTRKEGCEVSPERGYLREVKNETTN